MSAIHVFVEGKVQGVFFRKYTQKEAVSLKLTGWVRNLADGRVEFHAQGPNDALEALVNWCKTKGSPKSKVTNVVVEPSEVDKSHKAFLVAPDG